MFGGLIRVHGLGILSPDKVGSFLAGPDTAHAAGPNAGGHAAFHAEQMRERGLRIQNRRERRCGFAQSSKMCVRT